MTQPSLTMKFLSGEAYYRFSSLLTKGLGLVTTFYVLRALSLYQYGVLQLLLSLFSIGMLAFYLAGMAVSNDMHRLIGEGNESRAKKLYVEYTILRLLIAGAMTTALFFGAPLLSQWYHSDFIQLLRILSFYFIVEAFSASALMLVKSKLDFRSAALEPAYGKMAQLFGLVIFSLTVGITTREALIAGLIGNIASLCTLLPSALSAWKKWRALSTPRASVLYGVLRGYGKWDAVRQVVSNFVSNIQPWLIKLFINTEAVAIYSVALTLVDVAKSFLGLETLPSIVPRQLGDKALARRSYVLGIKYLLLFALFIMIGSALVVPVVISFLFPNYIPSLLYFIALLFTLPLIVFTMQTEVFLVAHREQKFLFTASLSRHIMTGVLLLILLPVVGLWGVVCTKLAVTFSIAFVELKRLFSKYTEYRFTFSELIIYTKEDRDLLVKFFIKGKELALIKWRSIT